MTGNFFALLDQQLTASTSMLRSMGMLKSATGSVTLADHLVACPEEQRVAIEEALRAYVFVNLFSNPSLEAKTQKREALKDALVQTVGKGALDSVDKVETALAKFDAVTAHWNPKTTASGRVGAAR